MIYQVYYVDDEHKKHLLFVSTLDEVKFIQRRFDYVKYTILHNK